MKKFIKIILILSVVLIAVFIGISSFTGLFDFTSKVVPKPDDGGTQVVNPDERGTKVETGDGDVYIEFNEDGTLKNGCLNDGNCLKMITLTKTEEEPILKGVKEKIQEEDILNTYTKYARDEDTNLIALPEIPEINEATATTSMAMKLRSICQESLRTLFSSGESYFVNHLNRKCDYSEYIPTGFGYIKGLGKFYITEDISDLTTGYDGIHKFRVNIENRYFAVITDEYKITDEITDRNYPTYYSNEDLVKTVVGANVYNTFGDPNMSYVYSDYYDLKIEDEVIKELNSSENELYGINVINYKDKKVYGFGHVYCGAKVLGFSGTKTTSSSRVVKGYFSNEDFKQMASYDITSGPTNEIFSDFQTFWKTSNSNVYAGAYANDIIRKMLDFCFKDKGDNFKPCNNFDKELNISAKASDFGKKDKVALNSYYTGTTIPSDINNIVDLQYYACESIVPEWDCLSNYESYYCTIQAHDTKPLQEILNKMNNGKHFTMDIYQTDMRINDIYSKNDPEIFNKIYHSNEETGCFAHIFASTKSYSDSKLLKNITTEIIPLKDIQDYAKHLKEIGSLQLVPEQFDNY